MKLSEFDYELAPERIAQRPAERRDEARLLVLERGGGALEHRSFTDLPELLDPGDLVVLNDTRVVPARLLGSKPTGGRVEALLLEREGSSEVWRCRLRVARGPAVGSELAFEGGLRARVLARDGEGWRIELAAAPGQTVAAALERVGRPPLPPYIRREPTTADRERYQTVYARVPGAVAAPTAGLHFTPELLRRLDERGIERAFVTLHVGPGTFAPVRVEEVERHTLPGEAFRVPPEAAAAVAGARARGGRVVAVGTTVVRSLEAAVEPGGPVRAARGRCELFIRPGHRFRAIDALVTNFHLPRTTLLMLVCAFAGRERVLAAYREAIRAGYRFYSYGDAMLVIER